MDHDGHPAWGVRIEPDKEGRPVEKKAWRTAQYIARLAIGASDFTDGGTHYDEANLHPAWAAQKRFVGQCQRSPYWSHFVTGI
jgi:hypothetical protein